MSAAILNAALAAGGVVVGAVGNHYLQSRIEIAKDHRELRMQQFNEMYKRAREIETAALKASIAAFAMRGASPSDSTYERAKIFFFESFEELQAVRKQHVETIFTLAAICSSDGFLTQVLTLNDGFDGTQTNADRTFDFEQPVLDEQRWRRVYRRNPRDPRIADLSAFDVLHSRSPDKVFQEYELSADKVYKNARLLIHQMRRELRLTRRRRPEGFRMRRRTSKLWRYEISRSFWLSLRWLRMKVFRRAS